MQLLGMCPDRASRQNGWARIAAMAVATLISGAASAAEDCNARAEGLREAFDMALADSSIDNRVSHIVNVEDRREFGCHLIFDMTNGDQVQGIFTSSGGNDVRWSSDSDAPREYERRVMRKTLTVPLALLRPPPAPTAPAKAQTQALPASKPIIFDHKETCGQIMRGLDYQGAYDQLHAEEAAIEADIRATYRALAETDMRLSQSGLTAKQIATNRSIRESQAKHIDFQTQLVHHLYLACPPYINTHHFDGR